MTWSLDKCLGILDVPLGFFFAWQAQGVSAHLQKQTKLYAASQAREPKDYLVTGHWFSCRLIFK